MLRFLYTIALYALWPAYALLARLLPSAIRFRTSRRAGLARMEELKGLRPAWLHAASVGELDQARALAREIRRHSNTPIIVSVFSMSARIAESERGIDALFYLPLDFPHHWRIIREIDPSVFVTMSWDVWPNLLHALAKEQVPCYLSSASIATDNRRLAWPWVKLLRPTYDLFSGIGVITSEDVERFRMLVSQPGRVRHTGDSRYDQVFHRLSTQKLTDLNQRRLSQVTMAATGILILASTYEQCEAKILPGLARVLQENPGWRALIFPHEINSGRISSIRNRAHELSLRVALWSDVTEGTPLEEQLILVDELGLLAFAYRNANFAYVGGAFHHRVHNTAEPAALGVPVLTGPSIDWAGVARELEGRGGLLRCNTGAAVVAAAERWIKDEKACRKAGAAAQEYLKSQTGASSRFYETFLSDVTWSSTSSVLERSR